MVMLPTAKPPPVGVAVMVTVPVVPPKVPVAVVPLPEILMMELLLVLHVDEAVALKVTDVVVPALTVLPLHPVVQVTVLVVCPIVTGTEPVMVPSVVSAVIVTGLLVLATTAVILPLSVVLLTVIWAASLEVQLTDPVKVLVLPSS